MISYISVNPIDYLQEGDEYYNFEADKWLPVECVGAIASIYLTVRRKVESKYRLLGPKEKIQRGDECLSLIESYVNNTQKWVPCQDHSVNQTCNSYPYEIFRRLL